METLSISHNNRPVSPSVSNEGFCGLLNVHNGVCQSRWHSSKGKTHALVRFPEEQSPSFRVASTNAPEGSSSYIQQDESVYLGQPTSKEELAAMRESAMRARLMRRLSDANLYGRHIQRQLLEKEAALLKCKSELATMETEIKNLLHLAQEIASEGPRPGSRKINGKYIQSHFILKLKELHECVARQVEDIDTVCYRDVPLVWYGMAEDVQVMGSFNGWSQGQPMSPEASSYFTKFTTTLKLRPGRYQIKFMVDGEWKLSPDLAQVGEGMTINNLLVVT